MDEDILGLLIGLVAVSIPIVAITARQVVRPLVDVLGRLASDRSRAPEKEVLELRERVDRMERQLTRVQEEQRFMRLLHEGQPAESAHE